MRTRPVPGSRLRRLAAGALGLLLLLSSPLDAQEEARRGTYLRLLDTSAGTVDQVAAALADAFAGQGLEVLANERVQLDAGFCAYGARVLVLHDGNYALTVLARGVHAAFALPLRIAVYEDEEGVHAAAVNPGSLNRTMVAEEGMDADWAALASRLSAVVSRRFPGDAVTVEYGQWRDEGRIGKTMGVMAGGPFPEKVQTVLSVPAAGTTVADVARRLEAGMATVPGEWEWGMRTVFSLVLPQSDVAVLGVTGGHMATRAFGIVKAGNQKDREKYACPGLDHAAAFPLELVVVKSGDQIQVQMVDAMFRMKMYFEDAGKIAFMKNMGMPGSIADEIRKKVEAVLRS